MKKIIAWMLTLALLSAGLVSFAAGAEYTESFDGYGDGGSAAAVEGWRALTEEEKIQVRQRYNKPLGANEITDEPVIGTRNGNKVMEFIHTTQNPRRRPAVFQELATPLEGQVNIAFTLYPNGDAATQSASVNFKMPLEIYNQRGELISIIMLNNSDGTPKRQMRVVEGQEQTPDTGTPVFDWSKQAKGAAVRISVQIDCENKQQTVSVADLQGNLLNTPQPMALYQTPSDLSVGKLMFMNFYYEAGTLAIDDVKITGEERMDEEETAIAVIRDQIREATQAREIYAVIANAENQKILAKIQNGYLLFGAEKLQLMAEKLLELGTAYEGNAAFKKKFIQAYAYARDYQDPNPDDGTLVQQDYTNRFEESGTLPTPWRALEEEESDSFRSRYGLSAGSATDKTTVPEIGANGAKTGLKFEYVHASGTERERPAGILELDKAYKGLVSVKFQFQLQETGASYNFKMPVELLNDQGKPIAILFLNNSDGGVKGKISVAAPKGSGIQVPNEGTALYSWPGNPSGYQYTMELRVNTVMKTVSAFVYNTNGELVGSGEELPIYDASGNMNVKSVLAGCVYAGTSTPGSRYAHFINTMEISSETVADPVEEGLKLVMNAVNQAQDASGVYEALAAGKEILTHVQPELAFFTQGELRGLAEIIERKKPDTLESFRETVYQGVGLALLNCSEDRERIASVIFQGYREEIGTAFFEADIRELSGCRDKILEAVLAGREYTDYSAVTRVIGETVALEGVNTLLWTGIPAFVKSYGKYLNVSPGHGFFSLSKDGQNAAALKIKQKTPISALAQFLPILNSAVTAVSKSDGGSGLSNIDNVIRKKNNSGRASGMPVSPMTPALASPKPSQPPAGFTDLDGVPWAKEAVEYLSAHGIVSGKTGTLFAPYDPVTREEFVKLAAQAFGLETENAQCAFRDVDQEDWVYPYVAAAVEAGLVNGISTDLFGMGTQISREDIAVILYRGCLSKADWKPERKESGFADEGQISDYAVEAAAALRDKGIIRGEDNFFFPKRSCTRAEAASMVYRIIKEISVYEK